ncbi:MAG: hypothetical protein M1833_001706, partial [Piccolia ochrophora]
MADQRPWEATPRIKASTESGRMALLTFSLIGLQFTWGFEMTYFTPYLLQLGLAKSQTSLVWIAAPLSGLIVQPLIGVASDSSTLRWGRRRPYMLVGAILVAVCLLTLAWASEIAAALHGNDAKAGEGAVIALAVFCIYAVDFAINIAVGRMLGFGHLLGYIAGTFDISTILGSSVGGTQFKQLSVIAAFMIVSCVAITCYCVEERPPTSMPGSKDAKQGVLTLFSTIWTTARHLPRRIEAVCWITFWSWIGYGTTWVGETYYRENEENARKLQSSKDILGDIARKGSLALVLFSLLAFAASVTLPWLVESPEDGEHLGRGNAITPSKRSRNWRPYQPHIQTAWALSQLVFSCAMILTPCSRSYDFATILVTVCGIPWAMTGWAPLAIAGVEINKLKYRTRPIEDDMLSTIEDETELSNFADDDTNHQSSTLIPSQPDLSPSPGGETAGVYLGILNIFATIPQFIGVFISMIAFAILEPGKSPELAGGTEGVEKDPSWLLKQKLS